MSKTKHRYNKDDNYGNDDVAETKKINRSKQKRFDRALRTKNIKELIELEDEGTEEDDYLVQNWNEYYYEDDYK